MRITLVALFILFLTSCSLPFLKQDTHSLSYEEYKNALPKKIAQSVLFKTEKQLKTTNTDFKIHFPDQEWRSFLEKIYQKFHPRLCIVGHFHPENLIQTEYQNMTGIVAPAWCSKQQYLSILPDYKIQLKTFHN